MFEDRDGDGERHHKIESLPDANRLNEMPRYKERMLDEAMDQRMESWDEKNPFSPTDGMQKSSAGFPSDGL